MYRNSLLLGIVIFSFLLNSCKDGLINFNIDFTQESTIPASTPINTPIDIMTPETTTNTEQELEVRDSRKNLVEHVFLEVLTIEITAPESQDFNFLKEIEIFIDSDNNAEEKVAFKKDIPEGTKKLNCEVLDIDLQKYLLEDQFKLRIKTITDQLITQDIEIEIFTDFNISAKVI